MMVGIMSRVGPSRAIIKSLVSSREVLQDVELGH